MQSGAELGLVDWVWTACCTSDLLVMLNTCLPSALNRK